MSLAIEHSDNSYKIAPTLRFLRGQFPQDVFDNRLATALQNGQRVLLANNPDPVGCLTYHFTQDIFWGKTLYIDDLVIDPDRRGQDIGTALLDRAKDIAAENACDHVRLCSGLTRVDAHRFYETNKFIRSSLQFAYAMPKGEL